MKGEILAVHLKINGLHVLLYLLEYQLLMAKVIDGVNVTERIQTKTRPYFAYCLWVLLHVWFNQPIWRKTVMVRPASWTHVNASIGRWISRAARRMLGLAKMLAHMCTVSTASVQLLFKYIQNVASTLKQYKCCNVTRCFGQSCLLPNYAQTNTYKLTHTQDLPMTVFDLRIFIVSESPHFSWPVFFTSSVKCHGGWIRAVHGRHQTSLAGGKTRETVLIPCKNQTTKRLKW